MTFWQSLEATLRVVLPWCALVGGGATLAWVFVWWDDESRTRRRTTRRNYRGRR